MRFHLQQLESPLHRRPHQQREDQRADARRPSQQPADADDGYFDTAARQAQAQSRRPFDRQHHAVARTRARVHADVDGAGQAHQQDGGQQHRDLQGQVIGHGRNSREPKILPRADGQDVYQRAPADLLAQDQRAREDGKAHDDAHCSHRDVDYFRERHFQHRPGARAEVAADHQRDGDAEHQETGLDAEKVFREIFPTDGFEQDEGVTHSMSAFVVPIFFH